MLNYNILICKAQITKDSGSLIYLYKTQGIVHSEGAAQHTEKDGTKKLLWN